MPWGAKDATRFTKKIAGTGAKGKRMWAHVADGELKSGASDGTAIKAANGVMKKFMAKHGK
jgi:hypothetical protein